MSVITKVSKAIYNIASILILDSRLFLLPTITTTTCSAISNHQYFYLHATPSHLQLYNTELSSIFRLINIAIDPTETVPSVSLSTTVFPIPQYSQNLYVRTVIVVNWYVDSCGNSELPRRHRYRRRTLGLIVVISPSSLVVHSHHLAAMEIRYFPIPSNSSRCSTRRSRFCLRCC